MALRNGTYVRSENADRLLYFSRWNYADASDSLKDNPGDFEIVWDQFEQVELFMQMNEIIQPGEWVEVNGKLVM